MSRWRKIYKALKYATDKLWCFIQFLFLFSKLTSIQFVCARARFWIASWVIFLLNMENSFLTSPRLYFMLSGLLFYSETNAKFWIFILFSLHFKTIDKLINGIKRNPFIRWTAPYFTARYKHYRLLFIYLWFYSVLFKKFKFKWTKNTKPFNIVPILCNGKRSKRRAFA